MVFLSVARAVEQISNIIQFIIDVIGKLVPFFIGIVLISIFWSETSAIFNGLKKLFLLDILTILLSQAIIIAVTAIRNHISPLRLIRKGPPTLIIAMSTGFDQFSLPFILLNQAGAMVKHNILIMESNHPPKKSLD